MHCRILTAALTACLATGAAGLSAQTSFAQIYLNPIGNADNANVVMLQVPRVARVKVGKEKLIILSELAFSAAASLPASTPPSPLAAWREAKVPMEVVIVTGTYVTAPPMVADLFTAGQFNGATALLSPSTPSTNLLFYGVADVAKAEPAPAPASWHHLYMHMGERGEVISAF
jgi:hypothetical protein